MVVGAEAEAFRIEPSTLLSICGEDSRSPCECFSGGIGQQCCVVQHQRDSGYLIWTDLQGEDLKATGVADGSVVGASIRKCGEQFLGGGVIQCREASQPIDSLTIFQFAGIF